VPVVGVGLQRSVMGDPAQGLVEVVEGLGVLRERVALLPAQPFPCLLGQAPVAGVRLHDGRPLEILQQPGHFPFRNGRQASRRGAGPAGKQGVELGVHPFHIFAGYFLAAQ